MEFNDGVKMIINYSKTQGLSFMLGAMLIVFYFAYPIGDGLKAFDLTYSYLWLIVLPIIGLLMMIQSFIFNGKINYFVNLIMLGLYSVFYVLLNFIVKEINGYIYYYVFILVLFIMIFINIYGLKILNKRDE